MPKKPYTLDAIKEKYARPLIVSPLTDEMLQKAGINPHDLSDDMREIFEHASILIGIAKKSRDKRLQASQ